MLHHYHVYLNTLAQWAVAKATCRDCYPSAEPPRESVLLMNATDLMFGLLHKEPDPKKHPKGSFYRAQLYPHLQAMIRRTPQEHRGWSYRDASFWMALEDRSHLTTPDFVTADTLVTGGVDPTKMPALGIVDVHFNTPRRRLLQFFFDYYGVSRTLEFSRLRILRGLIHQLEEKIDLTRLPDLLGEPGFHRQVNNLVITHAMANVPILYSEETAIEVVVDTLFGDIHPGERDVFYQDTMSYLGVNPTT